MRVLVTGGSGNGKSTYAERVACSLGAPLVYLATMQPYGSDGVERVQRHRVLRADKGFFTVECYGEYGALSLERELHGVRPRTVLLECLGNVVANVQFGVEMGVAQHVRVDVGHVISEVLAGVEALSGQCDHLVVVTNEVGSDGFTYEEATDTFVRVLGACNCALAACFDAAFEVSAGYARILEAPNGEMPW